jgi:hypothetical protein
MSNIARMMQRATAGAAGAGLDIDEVFKTHLYTGNGTAGRTITNNIDLSTEGGLIWTKARSSTYNHTLGDTANGVNKYLYSNTMADIDTSSAYYSAFNTNGYVIGDAAQGFNANELNANNVRYCSWTFRKAPKFFDLMTWTGNSASDRAISHNLGSVPGMIIVKRTVGGNENWAVWHREIHSNTTKVIYLDQTGGQVTSTNVFGATNPTSTNFYVGDHPLSNNNGDSYVAYVFAHNNNDGEFGPKKDKDVIKCGLFYTNSGGDATVTLGFEPQWLMVKRFDSTSNWTMMDNMRGWADTWWNPLYADATNGESAFQATRGWPNSDGFQFDGQLSAGAGYIYMAIRRGSLNTPTSASDVFAVQDGRGASKLFTAGFPVDTLLIGDDTGDDWQVRDRIRGGVELHTNSTDAEGTNIFYYFDDNTGIVKSDGTGSAIAQLTGFMWKRAPGYFDVVAYDGTGSATTVSHNLGVVPEMIWVKRRSGTRSWYVYHSALGNTGRIKLDTTDAAVTGYGDWNSTTPTSSVFSVGSGTNTNGSGSTYIAHLFATVPGISKVGSYDGNGSNQNIDCGFSNGAKFIIIKSRQSGSWYVFDTERGIVAGNDSHLKLDSTDAEAYADSIDPYSGGFNVVQNSTTDLNKGPSDESYIFYAVAA